MFEYGNTGPKYYRFWEVTKLTIFSAIWLSGPFPFRAEAAAWGPYFLAR